MEAVGELFWILLLLLVGLYFLPSFVAYTRKHQNAGAILIVNIFLGWTFIGWVVAVVWSMTQVDQRDRSNKT
jgi:hypothetical protein